MYGLLKREIYEHKSILFGILLIPLMFSMMPLFFKESEGVFFLIELLLYPFGYLLLGFMEIGLLNDVKKVSAYFYVTTPEGKEGVVAAKYWLIFLTSFGFSIVLYIFNVISGFMGFDTSIAKVCIILLFFVQLFLRSIELPFYILFGARYGGYVKTGIIFILTFAAITYGLFGPNLNLGFEAIMDYFMKILRGESDAKGLYLFISFLPHVVVLLYYVSYRISCKGYLKGVENYED